MGCAFENWLVTNIQIRMRPLSIYGAVVIFVFGKNWTWAGKSVQNKLVALTHTIMACFWQSNNSTGHNRWEICKVCSSTDNFNFDAGSNFSYWISHFKNPFCWFCSPSLEVKKMWETHFLPYRLYWIMLFFRKQFHKPLYAVFRVIQK